MPISLESAARDGIKAQLERILSSRTFRSADRVSRFLRYVVEESLKGGAGNIKEYAIGTEVFDRGEGFDPRSDSVVRVEAGRLRSKLRDYYDTEGAADPIVITVPKGSYVPVFRTSVNDRIPWRRVWSIAAPALSVYLLMLVVVHWPWLASLGHAHTPTIAVLQIENLGGGAARDSFCHGLADELASQLLRGGVVQVVTRGEEGPLSAGADLRRLGATKRATLALEGSASFSGDRVRVTMMLVELGGLTDRWVETFDRDLRDPLAAQSELARVAAEAVTAKLK